MEKEKEDKLVQGCIADDRMYQELLYKKYSSKMMGVCIRYVKNRSEAEDILQESFIKVFRYISQFKGNGSLEGWIKKIVVNTALERLRKEKMIAEALEVLEVAEDVYDNDIAESVDYKDLLKILQTLSPGYRTVFNLYAIEGYSHKEIATMLNITEGTSKSQLARARVVLQKMITAHHPVIHIST